MSIAGNLGRGHGSASASLSSLRSFVLRPFLFSSMLLMAPIAMALEEPVFEVLAEFGNVEIRRYEPYIVAEVDVPDGNSGFRALAGYIFGDNDQGEKMRMTAPVESRASADPDLSTYSFVMERKYSLATLPRPENTGIRLLERPERVVAVRRFSGRWTDRNFRRHLDELLQDLENAGIKTSGGPEQARYNSPFTPSFLRRNEVIIPVEWSKDPN